MPYLIRMLATRQRFTEPRREPHDSLYGRLHPSSHVVAFELLLDLAATQAGRRALARHVLEIAAVAAAPPRARAASAPACLGRRTSRSWWEDADGGGRRLLELIKRRLSSVDELSAVRLVASIDVALMVDGDDVRAENERLRSKPTTRAPTPRTLVPPSVACWTSRAAERRREEDLKAAERESAAAIGGMAAKLRESDDAAEALRRERDELKKRRESDDGTVRVPGTTTSRRRSGSATRCASSSTSSSGRRFREVKKEKGEAPEDAEDAKETLGYQVRTSFCLQGEDRRARGCAARPSASRTSPRRRRSRVTRDAAGRLAGAARDAAHLAQGQQPSPPDEPVGGWGFVSSTCRRRLRVASRASGL